MGRNGKAGKHAGQKRTAVARQVKREKNQNTNSLAKISDLDFAHAGSHISGMKRKGQGRQDGGRGKRSKMAASAEYTGSSSNNVVVKEEEEEEEEEDHRQVEDTGSSSNNVVVKEEEQEEEEEDRQVGDTGSSSNNVVVKEEEEEEDRQVEDTGSSTNNVVVKEEDAPEIAALVEALKAAADMPEIGCATLLRIMHGHLGKVDAIVEAMKANRSDAQVQQLGCTALLKLVDHDEDNLCSVWKDGRGVWFVVQAMKAHQGDAGVQRSACEALDGLVRHFDHRRRAENKGAVGAVVEALKVHVNDAQVMKSGCSALLNLMAGRLENIDRAVGEGGVETVIEEMKSYTSNAEVQLDGCLKLKKLGPRVLEEGGVGVIVGAMRAHTSNADVQIAGCGALKNTLSGNLLENRKELTEEVTAAVFEAMKNHGDDHEVISAGFQVLSKFEDVEAGISAVLGAMKVNRSNSNWQEQALKVLRSVYAPRKELTEEVTAAVFEAMKNHGDDHEVISAGFQVLSKFEDVEAGLGISAVLGAMEVNRSNSNLQEQALRILRGIYMCKEKEYKEETRRISAVVEAMRAHSKNNDLQDTGCEILLSLAEGNDENRIRVVEAGGLEAVIEAFEALENHDLEWIHDWKDLAVLLNQDDDTQSRAGEAGAVEAVVKMIQEECTPPRIRVACHSSAQMNHRHYNNFFGKERAVRALMKLVPGHEGNRRRFVEAGGFEALKEQYRSSRHSSYDGGMLCEHTRDALIALYPSWKPHYY